MYIQYETMNFTQEDFDYFLEEYKVQSRKSTAKGDKNKGVLITFDTLTLSKEQFEQMLLQDTRYELLPSDRNTCGIINKLTNVSNITLTNVSNNTNKCNQMSAINTVKTLEDELIAAHFVKTTLNSADNFINQTMVFTLLNEVMKKAKKNRFRFLTIDTLFDYIPLLKIHLMKFDIQNDVNYMYNLNYEKVQDKEKMFLRELKQRIPDKIEALYIYYFFCELYPSN